MSVGSLHCWRGLLLARLDASQAAFTEHGKHHQWGAWARRLFNELRFSAKDAAAKWQRHWAEHVSAEHRLASHSPERLELLEVDLKEALLKEALRLCQQHLNDLTAAQAAPTPAVALAAVPALEPAESCAPGTPLAEAARASAPLAKVPSEKPPPPSSVALDLWEWIQMWSSKPGCDHFAEEVCARGCEPPPSKVDLAFLRSPLWKAALGKITKDVASLGYQLLQHDLWFEKKQVRRPFTTQIQLKLSLRAEVGAFRALLLDYDATASHLESVSRIAPLPAVAVRVWQGLARKRLEAAADVSKAVRAYRDVISLHTRQCRHTAYGCVKPKKSKTCVFPEFVASSSSARLQWGEAVGHLQDTAEVVVLRPWTHEGLQQIAQSFRSVPVVTLSELIAASPPWTVQ